MTHLWSPPSIFLCTISSFLSSRIPSKFSKGFNFRATVYYNHRKETVSLHFTFKSKSSGKNHKVTQIYSVQTSHDSQYCKGLCLTQRKGFAWEIRSGRENHSGLSYRIIKKFCFSQRNSGFKFLLLEIYGHQFMTMSHTTELPFLSDSILTSGTGKALCNVNFLSRE